MHIPSKSDGSKRLKELEQENTLLRKVASDLERTIDAMRRAASQKAPSNAQSKKSSRASRRNR
jgi:hypothetical protein